MYAYFCARGDDRYSRYHSIDDVAAALNACADVVRFSACEWRNSPGQPWVRVYAVHCSANGSYRVQDWIPSVNNIQWIVSLHDPTCEAHYFRIASEVADALAWEIVEEP